METFEICFEHYDALGFGLFLRSSTRGAALVANRTLVGTTGISDLEFGSAFTAEIAWRIGQDDGTYRGIAAAVCNDDVAAFAKSVSGAKRAGSFYVFAPTTRAEIGALANGSVADQIIYLPRFPEAGVAATTSREEVEWSLYDPQARFLPLLREIAEKFELPFVEVSKTVVERETLEALRAYVPQIAREIAQSG